MRVRPFPAGPAVMGIVNLTPDSFSDGGELPTVEAAVGRALRQAAEGASILDLGAESTRPGATPVDPLEERERLLPVLAALRPLTELPISIDTRNASTARAALELGADAVNDVSLLRHDPELARAAAERDATLVLCHSRGTPATMQASPAYHDVVREVCVELHAARARALVAGCRAERIVLDPGIGFGKTFDHNLELLRRLPEIVALGAPVLVGASRKRFLARLLGTEGLPAPEDLARRASASVGVALAAVAAGARYVRCHDVAATCDALVGFEACRAQATAGAGT